MSLVAQLIAQHAPAGAGPVTVPLAISPVMATELLRANLGNRELRRAQVDKYAYDMASGRWELTHQAIAFNRAHVLIDGQHRLSAVVQSRATVTMLVTFNVEARTQAPIDRGLSRTLGDITQTSSRTAAVAAALVPLVLGEEAMVTHVSVSHILECYGASIAWATKHVPRRRHLGAAVLAGFAFAYQADPRSVSRFVAALRDCDGGNRSAVGAFMRRSDCSRPPEGGDATRFTLRCLELYARGRKVTAVTDLDRGLAYFFRLGEVSS